MAKQLNINLGFTADTSQAKAQIMSLQTELTKITQTPISLLGNKTQSEINGAIKSVAELQQHLKAATNINTGTLDFSKLSDSIKKSGITLQEYGQKLRSLGPSGQQAFNQLANAVAQSEIPIRRSNALLSNFMTTLKNTARWQLSSSMLHGLMGGLQSAVGYAKDLNRSLNDIRIVTGYNIDQMSRFADKANKAAKALSATTTDYTKASLIYFQQGLKDSDVIQRTETTLKMANVTGQSAQEVSDQMTAIWNNFYDGSKSIEYYSDVITALGAATASSSDEIAQGLEKFASVAETVGLSYEYATAALATITSETRQSADVVGTALKTLFARIQDLELGETLEDGTTLGSYSEALQKVGIEIKDQSGELKKMDTILNEMGAKWKTLSGDQQTALAQNVAGVRQYTQLMALMNNWDKMKQNVNVANNSAGTLQEQQKIYEESWQAASKRVKAAMEGVFQNLIDDKAFISILNIFEDIIKGVDNFIDGIGGLRGVLTSLGAVLTKVFSAQIAQSITNMATSMKLMTAAGREAYQRERSETLEGFAQQLSGKDYTSNENQVRQKYLKTNLQLQQEFIDKEAQMNNLEKMANQTLLDRNKILGENAIQAAKALDAAEGRKSEAGMRIRTEMAAQANGDKREIKFQNALFADDVKGLTGILTQQEALQNSLRVLGDESLKSATKMSKIKEELKQSGMSAKEIDKIEKELKESGLSADVLIAKLAKLQNREQKKKTSMVYGDTSERSMEEYRSLSNNNTDTTATGATKKSVEEFTQALRENIRAKRDSKAANEELRNSEQAVRDGIDKSKGAQQNWANTLVTCANGVMSLFSAINMLQGAINTLKNPDMSGWEKFLSIGMTIAMIIPMIVSAYQGLKVALSADTITTGVNTAAKILNWMASKKVADASKKEKIAQDADTDSNNKNTTSEIANAAAKKANNNGVTKTIGKDGKEYFFENGKRISNAKGAELLGKGAGEAAGGTAGAGGLMNGLKGWGTKVGSSFSNLGQSILKFGKAYGVTVAGVVAGLMVMNAGFKKMNATADAAKKANEKAKQSQKDYNQVLDLHNQLMTQISSYSDAANELKELTAGTAEYKEKLIEANDAALALIRSQGLIAGQDYNVDDITGEIKINSDALERVKSNSNQNLLSAQMANTRAQQDAREADLALKREEFNKEYAKGEGFLSGSNQDNGGIMAGAGAGMATGAVIGTVVGSIFPLIGNAVGAAVGTAIGGIAGAIGGVIYSAFNDDSTDEENRALDVLAKAYEKQGNSVFAPDQMKSILESANITDPQLIKSLQDAGSKTEEMVKAIAENTKAVEMERRSEVVQIIADNVEVQKSEYKDDIVDQLVTDSKQAQMQNTAKSNVQKQFEGLTFDENGKANADTDLATRIFDYAKEAGLIQGVSAESTISDFNTDFNTITYSRNDAEGGTGEINLDTIINSIIQNDVQRQIDGFVNDALEALNGSYTPEERAKAYRDTNIINKNARVSDFEIFRPVENDTLDTSDSVDQEELNQIVLNTQSKIAGNQTVQNQLIKDSEFLKTYKSGDYANLDATARAALDEQVDTVLAYLGEQLGDQGTYTDLLPEVKDLPVFEGLETLDPTNEVEMGTYNFESLLRILGPFLKAGAESSTETDGGSAFEDIPPEMKRIIDKFSQGDQFYNQIQGSTYGQLENLDILKDKGQYDDFSKMITEKLAPNNEELQVKIFEALSSVNWTEMGAETKGMNLLEGLIPEGQLQQWTSEINEFADNFQQKVSNLYSSAGSQVGMSGNAFYAYAQKIAAVNTELGKNESRLIEVAQASVKQEQKLKTLGEKYKNLKDRLDDANIGTGDYTSACEDLAKALNDVYGEGTFDTAMVEQNAGTFKAALDGDIASLQKLQDMAGEQILIDVGADLSEGTIGDEINDWIGSQSFNNIELYADLDSTGMTDKFQQMLGDGTTTVSEMNKLLSGIGFEPEIGYKDMPIEDALTSLGTTRQEMEIYDPTLNEGQGGFKTVTSESLQELQSNGVGTVQVPYIKGKETVKTSTPDIKNGANGGKTPKTGGGSKPKKPKQAKKSDTVKRYKQTEDALDDIVRATEKANKATERLYGPDKIDKMKEVNQLLKEEVKLMGQKRLEAERHLIEDRDALNAATDEAKVGRFTFDAKGNISNYSEIMAGLYNELNEVTESARKNPTEAKSEKMEKIQERIEIVQTALDQYDETRELIQDLDEQITDKIYEIQDNNYEALTLEVELKLELSKESLEAIEHKLTLWEDDYYKRSEGMELYFGQLDKNGKYVKDSGVGKIYNDKSATYKDNINDLNEARDKGKAFEAAKASLDKQLEEKKITSAEYSAQLEELMKGDIGISQKDYIDGLKENKEYIYDDIEAMAKLKQTISEYYSETLNTANEQLSTYTDRIEHASTVLDHYVNIAGLLGKELDYEMMGNFLKGQAEIAKDQMDVSAQWYDTLSKQQEEQENYYNNLVDKMAQEAAAKMGRR